MRAAHRPPVFTFIGASLLLLAADEVAGSVSVRARIRNGTRHEAGSAEGVVLYRLQAGMEPIRELGPIEDRFEMDELDIDLRLPYLLQVRSNGVNYNELVRFTDGREVNLQFTVYDTTSHWDRVEVSNALVTMEKRGDLLRAKTSFVVKNRTDPPRTIYDPAGTFRFRLPNELRKLHAVTASSGSGMPVPQPAELDSDSSTYVVRTAFKPGSTELAIAYDIDYVRGTFTWREKPFYDIATMVILLSPSDVDVTADEGWETLDAGPSSRFLVLRRNGVRAGQTLEVTFQGGTALPATNRAASADGRIPHGTIVPIPDSLGAERAIVVVLMAAALGFGLLTKLFNPLKGK